MGNSIIRKPVTILSIIAVIVYAVYRFAKSKGISLGKVPSKPPKIRLVYSRNIPEKQRVKISQSKDVVDLFRKIWSSQIEIREEFYVLLLDRANKVIGYHVLSQGGTAGTVVDSKLLFALALESLANSIIIAHNHPSGALKPSQQDIKLTRRVKEAGETMDIQVLDHLIITKEGYYSFADEGLL
jgi:DNA repair protein RadC